MRSALRVEFFGIGGFVRLPFGYVRANASSLNFHQTTAQASAKFLAVETGRDSGL